MTPDPADGLQDMTVHTLSVPGARLHYEVRGSGPLLLVMGSPMPSAPFAFLADALASDHTVVTVDQRGTANSTIDDPEQDTTPQLRADDLAALIEAVGGGPADVFGSSGGAVTGLALVERHPGLVRTLVAHEPPLLELLPDAVEQRAGTENLIEICRRDGVPAAWGAFMVSVGFVADDQGMPEPPPSADPERDLADGRRFFLHEIRGTTRFVPDVPALHAGAERVVVGIGAESSGLVTLRTSQALAEQLGVAPVIFPGDHGGFIEKSAPFADVLRAALSGVAV